MTPPVVAALYVQTGGCYFGLPDVDPWDEARDARLYAGPYPVVAHPPCERWGRYSTGSPRNPGQYRTGDDGECFAKALAAVRRWGGVLEHPHGSKAFTRYGLPLPARHGGWTALDLHGGASCCVDQGAYGHVARKATWLYAFGVDLPTLRWVSSAPHRRGEGMTIREKRRGALERLSKRQRAATPVEFRDLLLSIARSSGGGR